MRSPIWSAAPLLIAALVVASAVADARAAAEFKATWDQVANIKDAAERIARIQRVKGAGAAYTFIDACYRTHQLAEKYGPAFEACITQDYVETNMLARIYTRVPPDVLAKSGAPSAEQLAHAMGRRITAAFRQYKMPIKYVEEFKKLVDRHGLPAYAEIVFPKSADPAPGGNGEAKPEDKPDGAPETGPGLGPGSQPEANPQPDPKPAEKN